MASKGGSLGRTSRSESTRKPPLPSFTSTKPRAKSDAKEEPPIKHKENATEHKHEKGDKTSEDSGSDPGNTIHNPKGESSESSDIRRITSHAKDVKEGATKTEHVNKTTKGDTDKPEAPKADGKKPVKTMVIPSRYMNSKPAATARHGTPTTTTTTTSTKSTRPATATTTTTTSGLRAKTPEKSAHTTTERHAKTPTKQPTTPRITTTTLPRTTSHTVPKRVTPTPTTPTRGPAGRKTPVPNNTKPSTAKHADPPMSPRSAALHKEDVVTQFNIKIAGLQTQLKHLALERDSVLFQQTQSEGSEQSDWDESLSVSVDGASENSSELGDERDEKYIEIVRRYRSTLSVLSQKIVILKTALTDAKTEYDSLQAQHKQLLIAHQQSLSDLDKISKSSDVAAIS